MRTKRLLLINPASNKTGLGAYRSTSIPPLSLAYVAALTPKDKYNITILDENIEVNTYPSADLVGITSYTSHIPRAYEIALKYRNASTPVVMGGIHVSMLPDEALNFCNSVVIGEAERIWSIVLNDFEQNTLKPKYFGKPISLDCLPFADRNLFKNEKYLWGNILTSRGCPMDCHFCSVTKFNGRQLRRRPITHVLDELSQISNKFIFFADDNILGYDDTSWLYEFFDAVIKRRIKKYFLAQTSLKFGEDKDLVHLAYRAGLRVVLIGIESVESKTLHGFNKKLNYSYQANKQIAHLINNIRKSGVAILGCFILGSDQDTVETFNKTFEFIKNNHIDSIQITKPTPLPGTQFYKELSKNKRILNTDYPDAWSEYRFTRMLYKPKNMEIKDVYEGVHYIKMKFYSKLASLYRLLFTIINTRSISTTIVSTLINMTYRKSWLTSDIYHDYNKKYLHNKFLKPKP